MKLKLITVISVSALMVSGCGTFGSSEFACKGMPDGVHCMSASDVYKQTDNKDALRDEKNKPVASGNATDESDGTYTERKGIEVKKPSTAKSEEHLVPVIEKPVPLRSSAKVLRIYIAPWEDKAGNLHSSNFIYTEIESRKWVMGTQTIPLSSQNMEPLSIQRPR